MMSRATFEAIIAVVKFGVWPWGERDEVSWTELCDYQPTADDPNAHLNGAGVIMFWLCQRLTYVGFWQLWAVLGSMAAKRAADRIVELEQREACPDELRAVVAKNFAGALGEMDEFVRAYSVNLQGSGRGVFEDSFRGAMDLMRGWARVLEMFRQADELALQIVNDRGSDFFEQYMAQLEKMLSGVTELRQLEDVR